MAADHDHNYTTVSPAHHIESLVAVGEHASRKKKQAKKRKERKEDKSQEQHEEIFDHDIDRNDIDEGHIDFKA